MPKFNVYLTVKIKAETVEEAHAIGGNAAVHLLETFNDDESIARPIYIDSGEKVLIPAALLSELIHAADCAADEREYSAERNRKDCEHEGARYEAERARELRRTFRSARAIFNRSFPKPRARHAAAASV